MPFSRWSMHEFMLTARLHEEAIASLWEAGTVSGEMHLGTGEEAIVAGVVTHLRDGDAMALDHRSTAALLVRGVEPLPILLELLGHPNGLCGGMGGHMHLFSREHLAASSGIVGASGPMAVGFALAAHHLRPGTLAVGFFGEGAMNQGMLMESLNLAAAWKLPVLFVCKDDGWSITTESESVTGGNLCERARSFGITAFDVDGRDVAVVWESARDAIGRIRSGQGPCFMRATCVHLEGHFLGLQSMRLVADPLREMPRIVGPLTRSFLNPAGASPRERLAGVRTVIESVMSTLRDSRRDPSNDPIEVNRTMLRGEDPGRLTALEDRIAGEVAALVASAGGGAPQ
jgi:pyruvate dehydrogenase E1 component alpha subunit